MADQIPDDLGPDLDAQAARYTALRRLAAAQRTVRRGRSVDRATWTPAQQTALWELHHGAGGEHMRELIDWDEPDDDEADDFTVDDLPYGRPFGCLSGPC